MGVVLAILCITAQGDPAASCTDLPEGLENSIRYHKVYHFNGDPPSREQDELSLWKTKSGTTCFLLNTIGANYHRCEISDTASVIGPNTLEFRKGTCKLTFHRAAPGTVKLVASRGWERFGRGGTCPKGHCGMYGEVESGTFRER